MFIDCFEMQFALWRSMCYASVHESLNENRTGQAYGYYNCLDNFVMNWSFQNKNGMILNFLQDFEYS